MSIFSIIRIIFCLVLFSAGISLSYAEAKNEAFDDRPLDEPLILPDWFKSSFLELGEDLQDANNSKRGLILYFGRHDCPYCKAQLETNWGQADIINYTRAHFDVVAIDVLGNRPLTDFKGNTQSEKTFAIQQQAHFTPSLFFYDKRGKLALKIAGYRPPYQFRAALEYVADLHHDNEKFHTYMARAEAAYSYGQDALNEHPDFQSAARLAQRNTGNPRRPLLIAFERIRCHACDVLHAGPLQNPEIRTLLQQMDIVQLNMQQDSPVITPAGKRQSSRQWAEQLGLSYAPTLIFYDEAGKEIIRVDSVIGFYRLRGVLQYVTSKAYLQTPNFQQWRPK